MCVVRREGGIKGGENAYAERWKTGSVSVFLSKKERESRREGGREGGKRMDGLLKVEESTSKI